VLGKPHTAVYRVDIEAKVSGDLQPGLPPISFKGFHRSDFASVRDAKPNAPHRPNFVPLSFLPTRAKRPTLAPVPGLMRAVLLVVVLDQRLGDNVGWMGTRTYTTDWDDSPYWFDKGYPFDLARPLHGHGICQLGEGQLGRKKRQQQEGLLSWQARLSPKGRHTNKLRLAICQAVLPKTNS